MDTVYNEDNLTGLKKLADNSVDAIITDSPYGLGKAPDPSKVLPDWLSKGYHEIRGKGFMGKEWDAFVPQPVTWKEAYRVLKPGGYLLSFFSTRTHDWGTIAIRLAGFEIRDTIMWVYGSGFPKSKSHLKPAVEPICVARKPGPLVKLNIDAARIDLNGDYKGGLANRTKGIGDTFSAVNCYGAARRVEHDNSVGRWPANICFDEDSATELDLLAGERPSGAMKAGPIRAKLGYGGGDGYELKEAIPSSTGGASRFFYVAKASPSERAGNNHPTVKPLKLMDQLIKLYSNEGDLVLDPFAGSGTTLVSCIRNNRKYIGFEKETESYQTCLLRVEKAKIEQGLFATTKWIYEGAL